MKTTATRKIHNVEQQSEEWFKLRVDYPFTASNFQAVATAGKGLDTLIKRKLSEKYTGKRKTFTNEHMERGNELESDAVASYELETGTTVQPVGFVTDSSIHPLGGVSPDGDVVGTEGLIEIKSYDDEIYLEALRELSVKGKITIPSKYDWQMQGQMLFTGKKWVDYVVFNPNFEKDIIIQRVYADVVKQQKIIQGLLIAEMRYKAYENDLKRFNLM